MAVCAQCGEENPPRFNHCGHCGAPLAAPAPALPRHELRKTVTTLFADLKDSTALSEGLDPETLHEVKQRYFDAMAAEIARHGGKVEKYIGDAVMAVFGLPHAHEDDALRAVRAAAGMRSALDRVNADLNVRLGVALVHRTGVYTGEVVANDDPGADQKLVTGNVVNVAARLQQAAGDNETYIGDATYRLVRDVVDVEPVEPLMLKGIAGPVRAFRLVAVRPPRRGPWRTDTPLVGRDEPLQALLRAWEEACADSTLRLVTVLGDPGVGKSRLVQELIDRTAPRARILVGRCLAYGDGVTLSALDGIVRGAADIVDDDAPPAALAKLLQVAGAGDIGERLLSAIGLSDVSFALHELYWAVRKLLETLAAQSPLLVLVEDLHCAQPAFLDLLENLLDTTGSAAVLLVATARHELLEEHPDWGERARSTRLVLAPLPESASAQVVANLLGSAPTAAPVVARIVAAAEGNPLFIEQMLSMLLDSGALRQQDGHWTQDSAIGAIDVPPTIHALLEARLDTLRRDARATIESASVVGLEFLRPAVEAVTPEVLRAAVGKNLANLSQKKLIDRMGAVQAEARFRFHHQMIRDTAYRGLLKRARAQMHIGYVRWADTVRAERGRAPESDEVLGFHLEQAHRYLSELRPADNEIARIADDAAQRLGSAGRRAFARGDMRAAASLFRRATALLGAESAARLALLPELAEALMELADFAAAQAVIEEAAAAAERTGQRRAGLRARLIEMLIRLFSAESADWSEHSLRVAHDAIAQLEAEGADAELAMAWRLVAFVHGSAGRYGVVADSLRSCIVHARRANDERLIARTALGLSTSALYGPTPVVDAIAQCRALLSEGFADRQVEGSVMCTLAQLLAMNAEIEPARALCRQGRALLRELGQGVNAASTALDLARVELLAPQIDDDAADEVQRDLDFLAERRESYFLSTLAARLAAMRRRQDRHEEAETACRTAEASAAADDIESQILWRLESACRQHRLGAWSDGERLARAALDLARRTESPGFQAESLAVLAAILSADGRADEATRALDEAIGLMHAKGDVATLRRLREAASRPENPPTA